MKKWFESLILGKGPRIRNESGVESQGRESSRIDLSSFIPVRDRSLISKDMLEMLLLKFGAGFSVCGKRLDRRLRRWDASLNLRHRKLIFSAFFALLFLLLLLPLVIRYFRGVPARGSPALVVPLVPINPTLTPDTLMFNQLKRKYHEKQTK